MKNVQGSGVTLLAAPDKVNPSRQIFADVVTLQRLWPWSVLPRLKAGKSSYSAIHNYEKEGVLLRPWGQNDMVYSFACILLNTEVKIS